MAKVAGVALLAFLASAAVGMAQPSNDRQIIIVTVGPADAATGIAMTRPSFPCAEACATAVKIMQEDIRGGSVTARCLRTH